jgi:FAD/FMN-containing dehydrogenase
MEYSPEVVARHLHDRVNCPVLADPLTLALYSTDASIYQIRPACVVLPQSSEDVVTCVQYAAETGTPIVGRGGGSGLAGETLTQGIVLDFSRYLDRVIETDLDAGWVRCEPGVVLERLNAGLAKMGRMFGPDPSSANRATIGGVIGNNATGAHSIKYGYTDAYVENLTVVLADGEVASLAAHRTGEDAPGGTSGLTTAIERLVAAHRTIIDRHTPVVKRNRS